MLTVPSLICTFLSCVLPVFENVSVPAPVFVILPPSESPLTIPLRVRLLPLATSIVKRSSSVSAIAKVPLSVAVSGAERYLMPELSVRIVRLLAKVVAKPSFSVAEAVPESRPTKIPPVPAAFAWFSVSVPLSM